MKTLETTLSQLEPAGSKTNPGGYVVDPQSLEQFEISDERSALEIATLISNSGYEPVWKDWDKILVECHKECQKSLELLLLHNHDVYYVDFDFLYK
jgi:2-iminoacetate synthase ThiH